MLISSCLICLFFRLGKNPFTCDPPEGSLATAKHYRFMVRKLILLTFVFISNGSVTSVREHGVADCVAFADVTLVCDD